MKCSKCGSELMNDAKFCTNCGAPAASRTDAQPQQIVCPSCNALLAPGTKFCTSCGKPVASVNVQSGDNNAASGGGELNTLKQRIFWNIQKGEIACRINESEFVHYDSAQGLIVNDGTTAYVRANGKIIAELHGGVYDFVSAQELERVLESRHGGFVGKLSGLGRFLINAVIGTRVKDKIQDQYAPEKLKSLDAVIESLKSKDAFSLQLKLDKSFSLVFGAGTAEDSAEFKPMMVRTKLLDMNVGVRAIFRITDFEQFARHFLADERVATTRKLADALQPSIQNAVQAVMQECEIDGTFIPAEVADAIKRRIAASSIDFHGLMLENIAEVVASNEDLERFRDLSRELYLSEKELDYLRRTNDFRNRLAAETNSQAIADARNDMQLYTGMQEINKDKLLADDEFEKFYTLLSREKRLRYARNENEIQAILNDIRKTELLREEDLDNLRHDIAERGYRRGQALRLMQLKDEIEFEKVRTAGQGEIALEELRINLDMQDITITMLRRKDEYEDERRAKERAHAFAERSQEIELENAEMSARVEQLRQLHNMNLEERRQEQEHELAMEHARQESIDKMANMTSEQIMAMGARENMDSEGARAFAESFSAGRNAEQVQRAADERIEDYRRHNDQIMEMMREMSHMATTMTGHIVQHKDEQRDEYRERLERQEDRLDHTQDSALDYTTRNNTQQPQAPKQNVGRVCPECGTVVADGIRFCAHCGRELS